MWTMFLGELILSIYLEGSSSEGFSLWGLVLASTNPPRLKPALRNPLRSENSDRKGMKLYLVFELDFHDFARKADHPRNRSRCRRQREAMYQFGGGAFRLHGKCAAVGLNSLHADAQRALELQQVPPLFPAESGRA